MTNQLNAYPTAESVDRQRVAPGRILSRRTFGGLLSGALGAAALSAVSPRPAQAARQEPLEFRPAFHEWAPGRILVELDGEQLYLGDEVIGSEHVGMFEVKEKAIEFVLTEEGGRLLEDLSSRHLDRPIAVLYAGEVVIAPRIRGVMGRRGVIDVDEESLDKMRRRKIVYRR